MSPRGSSAAPAMNRTRCSISTGLLRNGAVPSRDPARGSTRFTTRVDGTAGICSVVMSGLSEIRDADLEAERAGGRTTEEQQTGGAEVPGRSPGKGEPTEQQQH